MKLRRLSGGVAAAALCVVVGFASLAWACVVTDGAYVKSSPDEAAAGSEVMLRGGGWAPDYEFAIGWSSDGHKISELGRAKTNGAGAFEAVPVTIPEAAPGNYYLVVSQAGAQRVATFTVTGATASQPSSYPAPAGSASGSGARYPSRNSEPSASPEPAPSSGTGTEPSPARSANNQPARSGGSSPSASMTPGGTGAVPPAAEGAASVERPATASPVGTVERQAAARRSAAAQASPGTAGSPTPALAPSEDERTERAPAAATAKSAFADTWPGFEAGSSFMPSITRPEPATAASSSGAALALLGVTVALMALGSGFGLAEASRRRSLAHQGATR